MSEQDTRQPPDNIPRSLHDIWHSGYAAGLQDSDLRYACQSALSFLAGVEWNDMTSETDAANIERLLEDVINAKG